MPKQMESSVTGDSIEKLKGLQITSLDDNVEEEKEIVIEEEADDDDADDEEEEEEGEERVTLGFVEKPKNRWSLLRQLFPSKAGGVPVLILNAQRNKYEHFFLFFCKVN